MLWLEESVKEVLRRVDASDPLVEDCQNKWDADEALWYSTAVCTSSAYSRYCVPGGSSGTRVHRGTSTVTFFCQKSKRPFQVCLSWEIKLLPNSHLKACTALASLKTATFLQVCWHSVPAGGDQPASDGLWPPPTTGFHHIIHTTWEVTRASLHVKCHHTSAIWINLTIHRYRPHVGASNESTLSLFFRSLLPNFNLQVSFFFFFSLDYLRDEI